LTHKSNKGGENRGYPTGRLRQTDAGEQLLRGGRRVSGKESKKKIGALPKDLPRKRGTSLKNTT